ncbi:hypothetical protein ACJZ2D_014107 [Fusarium nematophilum]
MSKMTKREWFEDALYVQPAKRPNFKQPQPSQLFTFIHCGEFGNFARLKFFYSNCPEEHQPSKLSAVLVLAYVATVSSAATPSSPEACAKAICGDLGIINIDPSQLPEGIEPSDLRLCADHPLGRNRTLDPENGASLARWKRGYLTLSTQIPLLLLLPNPSRRGPAIPKRPTDVRISTAGSTVAKVVNGVGQLGPGGRDPGGSSGYALENLSALSGEPLDGLAAALLQEGRRRVAIFAEELFELQEDRGGRADVEGDLAELVAGLEGGLDIALQCRCELEAECGKADDGTGYSNGFGHAHIHFFLMYHQ